MNEVDGSTISQGAEIGREGKVLTIVGTKNDAMFNQARLNKGECNDVGEKKRKIGDRGE